MVQQASKCTDCEFTCRSKPSLKRHITMVHSSTILVSKPHKKQSIPSFNCTSCQSTFNTKQKMKKHVIQVHADDKSKEEVAKEEDLTVTKIAETDNLNDRIVLEDQENTDEDQTDDEEKNSPPRKAHKSNDLDKNEVEIQSNVEEEKPEEVIITDDLEQRIEDLIRVKPSTEPSLAGCLAVIDNLQEENDQLLVKCEMFEELVDNQNAEIQDKNAKLVQVSEEKNYTKEKMLKLEKHMEDMFVQCETHKSSPLNIKMQTLQAKVFELTMFIEAHNKPTQAKNHVETSMWPVLPLCGGHMQTLLLRPYRLKEK